MSIRVESLSRKWENFSIHDVSLRVADGEYFIVLGPTGAGKTLLLELIAGFHKLDSGKIWINNVDVTGFPPEKRGIGFVPQEYMLFPHMTVAENVEFGLKMHNVPQAERQKMVKETLEFMGLSHMHGRHPMTLSGGEQQKTALARALVIKPKILLLDEPLSALDISTQKKMQNELKRIHEELKITTVHVTHNQVEAFILADRLAIMNDGTTIQTGSPEQVFHKPKDDFVARFVGFENLFNGKILETQGGVAKIDIGGVMVEAVTERVGGCMIGVRPDDIIVSKQPFKSSMRNTLKGKFVDFVDMGSLVSLIVNVNGASFVALITKRSFLEMKLKKGSEVYLLFKASAVHVI
ncbi:MAG: tungstate ABC transporter ATP-binding protein WtpC [Candidatus Bathyarchaeia archaeon]|nr:tungstate ABC transporter ATP-binding protein WtpC [Candidatus Bathyarchaeia archaeon]